MNNQIISIIASLPKDTVFEITIDWCKAHGLNVTKGDVISFGKYFKKNYMNYFCKYNSLGSNNLNSYTKL